MTKIAISIVNYKLKDAIIECLASLEHCRRPDFELEIIVVDNNSQDGSHQEITAQFPQVVYLQNTDNLGFSGGNNVGITYALEHGADYVLILNPDVIVDANLIQELLQGFQYNPQKIGITVPKVYFAKGYEFHKDRYSDDEKGKVIWYAGGQMDWDNIIGSHRGVDEVDSGQYDQPVTTDFASGNCLLVKREVFEKVGNFDERYFLYYEDADFCMRIKKAGFVIQYVPSAFLWHKNAQASGGSGSPLQDYFISRNRLLFGFTYARIRTKIALFRESLRNLFSYPTRRMASLDFYFRRLGKGNYIKD